jgi:peptide/nickel transport system substrate-binding protein
MFMTGWVLPRLCVVALAGALLVEPAACVEITVALGAEPTTLDPQLADDGSERAINDNIYETLLARTPKGDLIPALAEGCRRKVRLTHGGSSCVPESSFPMESR